MINPSKNSTIAGIVERVEPGAVVLFGDNSNVHGNHLIARTDEDGRTFQRLALSDDTDWELLKSFPDR